MKAGAAPSAWQKPLRFLIPDARPVTRRRVAYGTAVVTSVALLTTLMAITLASGGLDLLDYLMLISFALTLPWTVVGFWNAVVGLVIMRVSGDPARAVFPAAAPVNDDSAIRHRTALLMCIRNEDAEQVGRNLDVMIDGLVNAGAAKAFHVYVLSDSNWAEVVATESQVFPRLRDRWSGILPVTYRRREDNEGFKAGNIRDFCNRWGSEHDYALVLDADSLMSADYMLRMVRTMQQNPRLGILQSLVVGMPTVSPFARIFQFGMRLGMRSYTLGSAWWQADCGPYWGHTARIRLKPFIDHCRLPLLPGSPPLGGYILSHDQVEAAFMRRAGYEVRVLADEGGSWEDNPPTLVEHIRRDLRWCQGNMQYWKLLGGSGLYPVSRVQLALAMFMYLGSAAWIAFMLVIALRAGLPAGDAPIFDPATGWLLFVSMMVMIFAPKLATVVHILSSTRERRSFGGFVPVVTGLAGELVFSAITAPILAVAHTRFLLGLPFGRAAVWSVQRRATHAVSFREGLSRLLPQSLFAITLIAWLTVTAPFALAGFAPFLAGLMMSVPVAMMTSWTGFGTLLANYVGLWRIPDELAPAAELEALRLPALRRFRLRLATARAALGIAAGD